MFLFCSDLKHVYKTALLYYNVLSIDVYMCTNLYKDEGEIGFKKLVVSKKDIQANYV